MESVFSDISFWLSGIGFLLFFSFLFGYVFPARKLQEALAALNKNIRDLGTTATPEQFAPLFTARTEWQQTWKELEKHEKPVAAIFTREALIDTPLETASFRLMPDFMTALGGLGILSAIAGVLLQGEGPLSLDTMMQNLPGLAAPAALGGIALGIALICLSFAATGFENKISQSLPSLAEELLQLLGGAPASPQVVTAAAPPQPEIPVAPVVAAPAAPDPVRVDTTTRDSAIVQQNLALALEQILSSQIERQTAAIHASTSQIGAEMAKSVAAALKTPLDQMVQAALQSAKQAENIERGLQAALKDMAASLSRDIGQAVTQSFDKPLGQMVQAVEQSAKRSDNAGQALQASVQGIASSLTETLEKPLEKMVAVVEQSGRHAEDVDRVLQTTLSSMAQKIESTFSEQIKGFNTLLVENAKSMQDMRLNVAQMMEDLKKNSEYVSEQTRSAIEKMDLSAKTILGAAEKFGEAGDVVNSQISHSHSLSRHMMESGMALNASATALGQVVTDYAKARDSIGTLITSLQEVAKGIEQKVTLNQSLVSDMQKVADSLKQVQAQTDDYLGKVSGVLSTGFSDFGKSVHDNLDRSTSSFQTSMGNSVELISVQMRNLTAALQDLPDLLRKPA